MSSRSLLRACSYTFGVGRPLAAAGSYHRDFNFDGTPTTHPGACCMCHFMLNLPPLTGGGASQNREGTYTYPQLLQIVPGNRSRVLTAGGLWRASVAPTTPRTHSSDTQPPSSLVPLLAATGFLLDYFEPRRFATTPMEDSSPAASSETLATTTTGNMSLLEVQSEQLAIKLQQEAYGGDGAANSTDGDAGVKDDASGAGRQQWPIPGAQDSSSFSQTPNASQGAWGVPGRSAADLLRSANASAAATPASSQEQSSSPPADTAATRSSSAAAAAAADLAVVPLGAESIGALVGMGIDQAWAAAALRRCGGNDVSRAVEYCFSHDMGALAEEDARAFEAATAADASQQQHQDNETQHQQPDADSDMAFALALDQEERRLFEARRSTAAATLATEQGTFGSKDPPQRWGVADAEALMDGGGEDLLSQDTELREDGDEGGGLEEEEGGGGFRAVPGGGRRKGKMPLFKNSEGEVVSKHDAVICGRMNARDASNLEGVGDLTAAGVRLGNRTFNSLKRDIRKKKEKGMAAGGRVEQGEWVPGDDDDDVMAS
ncbi:expressed unknown protein [Ectocarpus siliculosus]|uniref:UBA domain-containing protein n=1 Tax=Ectocarpus siliculosus TaxID=2880 RepID=D7FKT4_ECTSI|nr:expressed unknown protein [Ectocarpus siliculosus]|eukprot:CBJ29479.1 expressed unknown protein [Ectocarpus siliculosus]